jgi:hypothetical protein
MLQRTHCIHHWAHCSNDSSLSNESNTHTAFVETFSRNKTASRLHFIAWGATPSCLVRTVSATCSVRFRVEAPSCSRHKCALRRSPAERHVEFGKRKNYCARFHAIGIKSRIQVFAFRPLETQCHPINRKRNLVLSSSHI